MNKSRISEKLVQIFGLDSEQQVQLQEENELHVGGFLSYRRPACVTKPSGETIFVFLKMSDTTRSDLGDFQPISNYLCRSECVFYCVMAPVLEKSLARCQLEPAFPKSYSQEFNTSGSLLVMDDLVKQGYYVQKSMLTLQQAQCALKTLARLQAAYWVARTDLDFEMDDCMFGWNSPFCAQLENSAKKANIDGAGLMKMKSKFFFDNFASHLYNKDDENVIRDGLLRVLPKASAVLEGRELFDRSLPPGIIHGDFWLSNMMFKDTGGSLSCRLVDWQIWGIGPFGRDLAVLILSSLPNELLVSEIDNVAELFYLSFKEAFESSCGREVPISAEQANSSFESSLLYGVMWVTLAMEVMMPHKPLPVENVLANLAHILRTKLSEESMAS